MQTAVGKDWQDWLRAIREDLVAWGRRLGSWNDQQADTDDGTAGACITLHVPNNCLPILQK